MGKAEKPDSAAQYLRKQVDRRGKTLWWRRSVFENTQYKFWELVNAWVSIANDELTKGVTPDVEIEYRRTHDWYFCRLGVVRGEDLLTDG